MKLPEPKYKIERDPKHRYFVTDENGQSRTLPSVTTILDKILAKPALVPWAKKEALELVRGQLLKRLDGKEKRRVTLDEKWISQLLEDAKKRPDKIKDDAADKGTRCHSWIDSYINGVEMPIPEDLTAPLGSFMEWVRGCGYTFLSGDLMVASLEYGFAGALDALAVRPDHSVVLLDFKTSSGIYDSMALQVGGYAVALEETYGIRAAEAHVVRFDKKDSTIPAEHKRVRDHYLSASAFLRIVSLQKDMAVSHFE